MLAFVDARTAHGITSVLVLVTTATLSRPDVQEGDLILLMIGVGNSSTDTLSWPTGFLPIGFKGTSQARIYYAYKWAQATEPSIYAVDYPDARQVLAVAATYRGVARDYDFDPINHPNGFYAPLGSLGANVSGTSTSLTSVVGATPSTAAINTLGVYLFLQYAGNPLVASFDDIIPLEAIRASERQIGMSLMLIDVAYPAIIAPPEVLTVASSENAPWVVGSLVLEAFDPTPAALDNYKSKLIRGLLPEPYDTRLSSVLGKVLAVIGTGDNAIGGLMVAEDFLPDEL
jgi:hypothetical protein